METTYTVNGHKIVATVEGDPKNPPVFLIHGWMSHRGVWRQTLPALESKYYCIALDLLGFGNSEKPDDGDYSIQMQGRRIVAIADALGYKKFSLVGHSMGGQISMCIASMLAPERVEKLVSVAGVVTGQLSDPVEKGLFMRLFKLGRNRPWMYRASRPMMNNRLYVNWAFRPWFYDIKKMPLRDFTIDRNFAINPACHISIYEAGEAIHALDISKHLYKVKAPTLLIHGEEDATVPVEQAYIAQTTIPNNDLAILKKCGHFPMYEKTGQYLKALAMAL
jgi:pimeloyl-ACP methyl ester carboxylesterase